MADAPLVKARKKLEAARKAADEAVEAAEDEYQVVCDRAKGVRAQIGYALEGVVEAEANEAAEDARKAAEEEAAERMQDA